MESHNVQRNASKLQRKTTTLPFLLISSTILRMLDMYKTMLFIKKYFNARKNISNLFPHPLLYVKVILSNASAYELMSRFVVSDTFFIEIMLHFVIWL